MTAPGITDITFLSTPPLQCGHLNKSTFNSSLKTWATVRFTFTGNGLLKNFIHAASNIKWSWYAKKMFAGGRLGIVVQIANDHIRAETRINEATDLEQALRSNDHFWWMTKLIATF